MVAKNAFEDHSHERTLAPTLPQAVEHSIVATSITKHAHTHASKQMWTHQFKTSHVFGI